MEINLDKITINDNVKIPNFFIVGAPKSGTTALSEYLRQHPDIYFSYPKEPTFFCDDFSDKYRRYTSLEKYLNDCFYNSKGYKAVGEGTVWHMYSETAIDNILQLNPNAKFIALIRNPVELAYSMHSTELYGSNEDVEDFEKAWRLQEARKKGEHIPATCREPKILQYGEIAKTGAQVQRLLQKVNPGQVKIFLFDDFKSNTLQLYKDVLQFLDIPYDGRTEFPVFNENKRNKNKFIAQLLINLGRINIVHLKKKMGIKEGKSLLKYLRDKNAVSVKRPPLNPELKKEMIEYFKEDIQLLSSILNRDLSNWLK